METVELKADVTKEDLSAVFKAELNEHLQYIDRYVTASKVTGTSLHLSQAFTDYHYGWAHKILGAFGAAAEFDFSTECAGYAFLIQNGVPQERIPEIKDAWLSLRKSEANFHRFREVSEYLKQTDAEDTRMNRTKIALKIWDARGDAFLDLDGRWPGFDPATIHDKKTEAEFTDTNIKADQVEVIAATANACAVKNTNLPQPGCATDVDKSDQRSEFDEALISQFEEIVEQSCINNIGRWDKKTANQFRQSVNLFIGVLTESNVSKSSEIRQKHVAQLRTLYTQISPNYGRSIQPGSVYPTPETLRKRGELAHRNGEKVGLAPGTIRRHLGFVSEFVNDLRRGGFQCVNLDIDGLRPKKQSSGKRKTASEKPSPDRMKAFFELSIFTGCLSATKLSHPGSEFYHSSAYWCLLAMIYTGARRGEICNLDVSDVIKVGDVWVFQIDFGDDKRVKNESSVRKLPIPNEMLRLGFLEYKDKIQELGYKKLFPDLFSHLTQNDPGDRLYDIVSAARDNFNPDRGTEFAAVDWKRLLHAVRHGFNNTLRQSQVTSEDRCSVLGHSGENINEIVYTDELMARGKQAVIEQFPVISEHLEPIPIRLLDWVANCENPPWARKPRKQRAEQLVHKRFLKDQSK